MVSHRVNAERVMLLAWPRAILLQVAHPLVAAGVAAHSSFDRRRPRRRPPAVADGAGDARADLWRRGVAARGDRRHPAPSTAACTARCARPSGGFPRARPTRPRTRTSCCGCTSRCSSRWCSRTMRCSSRSRRTSATPTAPSRPGWRWRSAPATEDVPTTWAAALGLLQRVQARARWRWAHDGRAVGQAVLSPPLGPLAMPLIAVRALPHPGVAARAGPAHLWIVVDARPTRGGCRAS